MDMGTVNINLDINQINEIQNALAMYRHKIQCDSENGVLPMNGVHEWQISYINSIMDLIGAKVDIDFDYVNNQI